MFNILKLVYFLIKEHFEHFQKLTKFISVIVNEKCFVTIGTVFNNNTHLLSLPT